MIKLYGPYKCGDGRLRLVLVDTETRKKSSCSYPKFLYECLTGIDLNPNETIDHIDGNFHNNSLSNLRVLSREENARIAAEPAKMVTLTCEYCGKEFQRPLRQYKAGLKRTSGEFCSHSCVGKVYH